jgi:hypothetical protein
MISYNIGDSVVNVESLGVGNIIQIDEEANKVQVQYNSSGSTEWVLTENVKKLLLEIDPPRQPQDPTQNLHG